MYSQSVQGTVHNELLTVHTQAIDEVKELVCTVIVSQRVQTFRVYTVLQCVQYITYHKAVYCVLI